MEGMNEYKVKKLVLETKEQVDEIFEETTKLGVYHLNFNYVSAVSPDAAEAIIHNCRETRTTLVGVNEWVRGTINGVAAKDIYA